LIDFEFIISEINFIFNFEISYFIKNSIPTDSYIPIYSRSIHPIIISKIQSSPDMEDIYTDWVNLVPPGGHFYSDIMDSYIKPSLLTRVGDPLIIGKWLDIIPGKISFIGKISIRLKNSILKRFSTNCDNLGELFELISNWSLVIPPPAVGLILLQSGFISKVTEESLLTRLADYCYRSPARFALLSRLGVSPVLPLRRPAGPPPEFFSRGRNHVQSTTEAGRVSLSDVVQAEAEKRGVPFAPRTGLREGGCQVYRVGGADRSVYCAGDRLYVKSGDHWVETSIENLFQ
jgi:hypothetical protein